VIGNSYVRGAELAAPTDPGPDEDGQFARAPAGVDPAGAFRPHPTERKRSAGAPMFGPT